jgi:primosomal protein N'
MAQNKMQVYLLGAQPSVVRRAVDFLKNKFPTLVIAGFRDGYFRPDEEEIIINEISQKKEMILKWNEVLKVSHPVLIIATPLFLSIQREDLETIIVEKENSRGFISQIRPYLDFRKVIEIIGKKTNKKVVFGDMILRVETIQNVKKDDKEQLYNICTNHFNQVNIM